MCGIVGQFSFSNQPVAASTIQAMCRTIVHRGPDDEGVFTAGQVGLGMRRLSIIDLSGGHQPMHSADGRFTIVFNGEIYNYREIRTSLERQGVRFKTSSDTECILEAYALYGRDCLQLLNGIFAIAIWDAQARELFLARDRFGIKPLYLHQTVTGLAFASEVKALLADGTLSRTLDVEAFSYFLRYGYVASPATLLREVRQLPPAHYLRATAEGVTIAPYWTLEPATSEPLTDQENAERVYELVKQAVKRQMVSDVPIGAFLSGGLDSSSMVHLMSEMTGAGVNTYSIGFAGVDAFHNELDDAKKIAQRYRTNHHEIIVRPDAASLMPRLVNHLDQPLADSSFIVTYLVSQLASQTVKVIISGVGGDEIFGGYRRYLGPFLDSYYSAVPAPLRRAVATAASWMPVDRGSTTKNHLRLARAFVTSHGLSSFDRYDRAVQLVDDDLLPQLASLRHSSQSELIEARLQYFNQAPASDPLAQMQRLDYNTSLTDSLLLLTDKMSMATSLEARVPFLDHELVEAISALPSSLKIRNGRLRHIQKLSMKGQLPDEVMRKKKRGFGCPVGAWFRTDLRPLLLDTLSPAALKRQGLLDPATVARLVDEHETYREDRTDVLLALLTFQLWSTEWKVA